MRTPIAGTSKSATHAPAPTKPALSGLINHATPVTSKTANEASRELSTGPVTEEGKAAVSRNGWKHGRYSAINRAQFGLGATSVAKLFGKPCVTTCPFHPDNPERKEKPCGLVLDGLTHAGGSCLDKTVYVHALESLMGAMRDRHLSLDAAFLISAALAAMALGLILFLRPSSHT